MQKVTLPDFVKNAGPAVVGPFALWAPQNVNLARRWCGVDTSDPTVRLSVLTCANPSYPGVLKGMKLRRVREELAGLSGRALPLPATVGIDDRWRVFEEPAVDAVATDGEEHIHIARSDALPAAGGEASLSFTNNALGRLIDGIGTPGAYLEMRPWEGVPVGLVDGAAPGTLVRPAGTVALTLKVRVRVPVEVLLSAAQSVPSAP